jgi:hypothetical protein
MSKDLHVRASGTALVPDYDAQDEGVLRYVNRRRDLTQGHTNPKTGQKTGAWVPLEDHSEVRLRAEYLQELRAGTLVAATAETAQIAGVPLTGAATEAIGG